MRPRDVPNALAGEHLGGASSADPDGEEDHQQRGGEHHPASVGGRVPDGQGEGHRPAQSCRSHQAQCVDINKYICISFLLFGGHLFNFFYKSVARRMAKLK